jgi:catalase
MLTCSYHNNNPEGIHTLMMLFSDRGTPASLRNMNAYGNHTYKFTKEDNSFVYVKFHLLPDRGVKTMSSAEAKKLAGEEPDYHSKDMWDAIERGDMPTWTLNVQVMTADEAEKYHINIFDTTKVWPHSDYPLRPLGKLTLNRNVGLIFPHQVSS